MSSVKCTQCGLVNFSGATICKRCGVPLDSVEQFTDEQSKPEMPQGANPNPKLFPCYDCANPISRNAISCPHCGAVYKAPPPPPPSLTDLNVRSGINLVGLIALGVIIGVIVLWLLLISVAKGIVR
jgi:hypothetical protein